MSTTSEIAVIGLALRFPGASDAGAFWRNLRAGVESLTWLTPEDLAQAGVPPDEARSPDYVPARFLIDGASRFDADLFNVSPAEAEATDPQFRVFLECAWEALETAGLDLRRTRALVGVFTGTGSNGHLPRLLAGRAVGFEDFVWNEKDYLPTWVAFKLGLRGPAVGVQSFCSTSLVAVHLACQSILLGECDVALAGGVSLRSPDRVGYTWLRSGLWSPDGHCRPFDAQAGGTVFGDGAGVVVLKRLEEALADGDFVHAVIRGTAVNNDGAGKAGFFSPSVRGQAEVIVQAVRLAGVDPRSIGYVEAHGTGTLLGDPIEMEALVRAFRQWPVEVGRTQVGSVKGNIGHLDRAAGVAGLIKAILALQHGEIPPTPHLTAMNPHISLAGTPFQLARELAEWPDDGPRRAGVSSFGIGGTNAHVVLEAAPTPPLRAHRDAAQLLAISARSETSLQTLAHRLASALDRPDAPLLDAVARTLARRPAWPFRRAVVARTAAEAVSLLRDGTPLAMPSGLDAAAAHAWLATGQAPAASSGLITSLPATPFEHREYFPKVRARSVRPAPVAADQEQTAAWRVGWRRVVFPLSPDRPRWLVVGRAGGLADVLVERLRATGGEADRAEAVSGGTGLAIVDVRNLDCSEERAATERDLDGEASLRSLRALLTLVRSASGAERLVVVTTGALSVTGEERLSPAAAALGGALRVVGQERSGLRCHHVDLEDASPHALDGLARILAAAAAPTLALRGTHSWVPAYVQTSPADPAFRLRSGGVYAVTGGRGRIARVIALHLARRWQARIALIGRRAEDAEMTSFLADLAASGGDAAWFQADVTRSDDLRAALAECRARFAPLDGIFHTAGRLDASVFGSVEEVDQVALRAAFHAKLGGARSLEAAIKEDRPGFVVAVSSLSALLGGLGFFAYAAANAALDAFALSAQDWIPVDFDAWGLHGAAGMPLDAALESLEQVLAQPDRGPFVITRGDLPSRERDWVVGLQDVVETSAVPETLEAKVARIWRELFGRPAIAPEDHWTSLGGDSLLAVRMMSRLRKATGVDLAVQELFATGTLGAFTDRVRAAIAPPPHPVTCAPPGWSSLGPGERSLWILHHMAPGVPEYNLPSAVDLHGELDVHALLGAIDGVVSRHETLRSAYPDDADRVGVMVLPSVELTVQLVDLGGLTGKARDAALDTAVARVVRDPFQLHVAPLLRVALIRLSPQWHRLIVVFHHIVADGWSLDVFVRECAALYDTGGDTEGALPALPCRYRDVAWAELRHQESETYAHRVHWWVENLADAEPEPPMSRIPVTGDGDGAPAGQRVPLALSAPVVERAHALARTEGATLFMVLLAALNVLLARWSGVDDIRIGTAVARREQPGYERLIGFFLNTVVVRTRLAGSLSFRELVRVVRRDVLAAFDHADVPFDAVVAALNPRRYGTGNPLFDVLFILLNYPKTKVELPGLDVAPAPLPGNTALPLSITLYETDDTVEGMLEFDGGRFAEDVMHGMARTWARLCGAMVEAPDTSILAFPLLDPLAAAPGPPLPFPLVHSSVVATIRGQAVARPDAPAVAAADGMVTYAELLMHAENIAALLQQEGLAPEEVVGVLLPPGPEVVPALLGVLLAGCAYLPIEVEWPAARQRQLLEQAGARFVISAADGTAALTELRRIDPRAIAVRPFVPVNLRSMQAAYVLFTSGSTGAPRAVVVPHECLLSLAEAVRDGVGIRPEDRVLQLASLVWDTSAEEIYPTLCAGATIVIRTPEMRETMPGFLAEVDRLRVSVVDLPSSFWHELVSHVQNVRVSLPQTLRTIIVGGERVHPDRVAEWLALDTGIHLVNSYGMTEATAITTLGDLGAEARVAERGGDLSVGVAIPGVTTYVLGPGLELLPAGVPGELYIGGRGVSRGYQRDPGETSERFLPDPFSAEPGARMVRSGDRAWRRSDGHIVFLGRRDTQIKLRGQRLEPSEIEAVARALPAVGELVVGAVGEGAEARLVGWYTHLGSVGPGELRAFLADRLPPFMVPVRLIELAALPRTPSGKIDRRALVLPPEPGLEEPWMGDPDPVTELLAIVTAEVLGRTSVDLNEDFFTAGGTSLQAMRLVARLRETGDVEVTVRDVFTAPSLRALASRLRDRRTGPRAGLPASAPLQLSFAQERFWFLQQLEPESAAYNLAVVLRGLVWSVPILGEALHRLIERHEILRTGFHSRVGAPEPELHTPDALFLKVVDLEALPEVAQLPTATHLVSSLARRPFSLVDGLPPLRLLLFTRGAMAEALAVVLHHALADAWSLGALHRELLRICTAVAEGRPKETVPPRQFRHFAAWQRELLSGERQSDLVRWWHSNLAGLKPLELPIDQAAGTPDVNGAAVAREMDPDVYQRVRALGREAGATPFMVVLAVFAVVIARYTDQRDLCIGVPIALRDMPGLADMVGPLVDMLPVRLRVAESARFVDLVRAARDAVLDALTHRDLPFERIVEEVQPERDRRRTPLFQVATNHLAAGTAGGMLPTTGINTGTARFALMLVLQESLEGARIVLEYATGQFTPERAAQLLADVYAVAAASAPEDRALETPLPSCPIAAAPPAAPIPDLIDEILVRCEKDPEGIAVRGLECVVSRRELGARIRECAAALQALGVGPACAVVLHVERSVDQVVALVATLFVGGVVVPIDAGLPAGRVRRLVELVRPTVILVDAGTAARFAEDGRTRSLPLERSSAACSPPSCCDATACILFTSGSTGQPKGVRVPRRGVANRIAWMQRAFPIGPDDRVLQKTSPGFDVSLWEFLWPLFAGATLVLAPPGGHPEAGHLARLLGEERITVLHMVPSLLRLLLHEPVRPPDLRLLFAGGEALTGDLVELARTWLDGRLINLYGPTEASIDVTACDTASWRPGSPVSLGKPIDNVTVRVLDGALNPVPVGGRGEIYIGGVALAEGYLDAPALTAERFVPDPTRWGERLYRTGDLGQPEAEGGILYFGRRDRQVKLRGVRVELGEVETAILSFPGVRDTSVLLLGDLLAAAVAPEDLDLEALRQHLLSLLPRMLVPGAFVAVGAVPRLASGKVDESMLRAALEATRSREAPKLGIEADLARLWAEALGIEDIGRHDSFFALGGHSLLLLRVAARIWDECAVSPSLGALYDAHTLAAMAEVVLLEMVRGVQPEVLEGFLRELELEGE